MLSLFESEFQNPAFISKFVNFKVTKCMQDEDFIPPLGEMKKGAKDLAKDNEKVGLCLCNTLPKR